MGLSAFTASIVLKYAGKANVEKKDLIHMMLYVCELSACLRLLRIGIQRECARQNRNILETHLDDDDDGHEGGLADILGDNEPSSSRKRQRTISSSTGRVRRGDSFWGRVTAFFEAYHQLWGWDMQGPGWSECAFCLLLHPHFISSHAATN
jgi:hypothetical protein